MKKRFRNLSIIVVVVLVFQLACSQTASITTPTSTEIPVVPTQKATPKDTSTSAPTTTDNLVTKLDSVKSATIQIESEGTFLDPQVGMVVNGAGRGSGFIINSSGLAITNNHVVSGAAMLKVWVGGDKDKVYSARVLGVSECSDLAVIKIEGSDFPYLKWYSNTPKLGLDVYAAGYPLGDPEFTMTKGIISKEEANGNTTWASVGSVLEHDARINPGNSGGPLVDKDGKVVGINFASNSANQYFAITKAEADKVLKDLEAGKDVDSIGVNGQAVVTQDKSLSGIWVSSVKSGSPADKAGLKAGDIIIQMEGLVLATDGTKASYCQILRSHNSTDTLTLNVLRWLSKETLQGELNGRHLTVSGTYETSNPTQSDKQTQPTTTGNSINVTDNSKVIKATIPADWQYNGHIWKNTWNINGNSYPFTAATLTVSPDVKAFDNGYSTAGLFVAVSTDWAKIGGYANLLEGMHGDISSCTPSTSKDYSDSVFEGQLILYTKCNSGQGNAILMALRPIKHPTDYLVLFEIRYSSQAGLDEVNKILKTIDVNP